jgi:ABC-type branched-subunit amino acid transport system ATPase component
MLAISRALLFNPKLLVMDEPTEGLAPLIVQQVSAMLRSLAAEGEISVLLIEQNLGVAIEVADTIDVMVNGRIARSMPAAELAADRGCSGGCSACGSPRRRTAAPARLAAPREPSEGCGS